MKKILVIRFSSIGDIVLTTPVVRCLKSQLPEAEICFLTKPQFTDLVAHNPHIDKCFYLKENLSDTIAELKKESFDFVIDLHHNIRTLAVKQALGVPSRAFNKLNVAKWLLVNTRLNLLPNTHIVDRYMKTVKHLGVVNDQKGLDFFIPNSEQVLMAELAPSHAGGFVAVVIGAKHNTKKLPVEKIIALCKEIDKPIILVGGKEDQVEGEAISSASGENVINACGKLSLLGSASVLRQALVVVTHDTGMMHIAAALRRPVVSVWGNTVPAFGMYPYMPGNESKSVWIENKGLQCRPCSKIGYNQCPKQHFKCMQDLDVKHISEEVSRLAGETVN